MTTIDDLLGSGDDTVVALNERHPRRRARLQQLLDIRARLAIASAEQRSHRLPEGTETTGLLWAVEEAIHDGWPRTYYTQFPQWSAEEEYLLHEPGEGPFSCGLCRAERASSGAVQEPPDAA